MTVNEPSTMKQHQMTQRVTTLLVLTSLGLLAACSSDNGKAGASGVDAAAGTGGAKGSGGAANAGGIAASLGGSDAGPDPNCVTDDAHICAADLNGFPFVRIAIEYSDYCSYLGTSCAGVIAPPGETSVDISQPKAGTLCLTGTVSPGGWALLALEVAEKTLDRKKILEPFDALRRGITQLTMTIDSPPTQGVDLQANMIKQLDCPTSSFDCFYPPNFDFETITVPGQVTAALADFKSADPSQVLNTSVLHSFLFQTFGAGDFNFCVHDFNFLDAQGNVVLP